VSKLVESGLVTMDEEKLLRLTEEGRALAELTYSKHQYLKAFLLSVGVDEADAEKEACGLEHAISADTFRKITDKYPKIP